MTPTQQRIARVIAESGAMSSADIAQACGLTLHSAVWMLCKLQRAKIIGSTKGGRGAMWTDYDSAQKLRAEFAAVSRRLRLQAHARKARARNNDGASVDEWLAAPPARRYVRAGEWTSEARRQTWHP